MVITILNGKHSAQFLPQYPSQMSFIPPRPVMKCRNQAPRKSMRPWRWIQLLD